MIPDGLEGARGKGWSDGEVEDNGWHKSGAEEPQPAVDQPGKKDSL